MRFKKNGAAFQNKVADLSFSIKPVFVQSFKKSAAKNTTSNSCENFALVLR